ncbi:MAG: histidine phosphatase family protein [Chlamydiae bacterium]|nr:histidine phosphatase family protein [Chlamydiota bacterium]
MAFEKPTQLFFVRHGQTDWNVQGKLQGRQDIPLNHQGRLEAKELASRLKKGFDICFSSPSRRAQETALIITEASIPIYLENKLLERDFGPWEGRSRREYQEDLEKKFVETDEAMQSRVFECLEQLFQLHKGKTILVVSHGGVLRNILKEIAPDAPEDVPNCGCFLLSRIQESFLFEGWL